MGANINHSSISNSSRRYHRRYRQNRFNDINVTPMVDVMLVLLIIFMVTAPMLTTGVTVDLPDSNAAALPGQDEPLTISIQKNGQLYIQDTKISPKSLTAKLKAIVGEKTDTRIFVRADAQLDYGTVMTIVGNISNAGFTKVALVTETTDDGKK